MTSYALLKENYILYQDLLPSPTGMNLMLFHKLLKHKDIQALLQKVQQSKNTFITVHHDGEEIHRILGRVNKDGEHHWWETLFGWSPPATGVLSTMLHPVVIMFAVW